MSVNNISTSIVDQGVARTALRLVPTYKPRVLIVEDHDDTREMLRILLEMRNCHVMEACNGEEAVAMANREHLDLILMDGSLPLLDGLGATRRIRENGLLREVLILALNGWGTAAFNAAAMAAGCNDCMTKPIDFEALDRYMAPLFEPRLTTPKRKLAWVGAGR